MAFILFFQLLALLTLAAGKPILFPRLAEESPLAGGNRLLDVRLHSLGNSTVRAQITNLGNEDLRLVKSGSILDDARPTKKVNITGADSPTFHGAEVTYVNTHLSPDAFVTLAPNQTVDSVFDVAESHDLAPGKSYSALADGNIEYTKVNTPSKFVMTPYTSNSITFDAPATIDKHLATRSTLSCTDEYNKIVQSALTRAANMAKAGAEDARNGTSALFKKYFMSTEEADRTEVAERLEAIAKEATTTGSLTYYCQPSASDSCGGNIAAMTYPTMNRVVNCQAYYDTPAEESTCGYLDQAAISLHEFSHATAVYAPGTEDVAYGYDSVLQLSTSQAKNNADSFAYYASAVFNGCSADDSENQTGGTITLPWNQGDGTISTGTGTSTGSGADASSTATIGSGWIWPIEQASSSGTTGSETSTGSAATGSETPTTVPEETGDETSGSSTESPGTATTPQVAVTTETVTVGSGTGSNTGSTIGSGTGISWDDISKLWPWNKIGQSNDEDTSSTTTTTTGGTWRHMPLEGESTTPSGTPVAVPWGSSGLGAAGGQAQKECDKDQE